MSIEVKTGSVDVRIENMKLIPEIEGTIKKLRVGEFLELEVSKEQLLRDRVKRLKKDGCTGTFRVTRNRSENIARCYRVA